MSDKLVVSARIDIKVLAEVALFLDQAGRPPTSRSDLVRRTFRTLSFAGKEEGLSRTVESEPEAVNVLETYGITFEDNREASQEIAEMLSEESLKGETTDTDVKESVDEVFSQLEEDDESEL